MFLIGNMCGRRAKFRIVSIQNSTHITNSALIINSVHIINSDHITNSALIIDK